MFHRFKRDFAKVQLILVASGCTATRLDYRHPRPAAARISETEKKRREADFPPNSRSLLGMTITLSPDHPRKIVPYSPVDPHELMYDVELVTIDPRGKVTINSNGIKRSARRDKYFEGRGSSGLMLLASDPAKQSATIEARWRYTHVPDYDGR